MSTTRFDKYELQERLGHGGIAEVWKALDLQLQRHVALKLLRPDLRSDPKFLRRFEYEARLIASLHHPNIVQIHDFQVHQPEDKSETPIAYMVMDYVVGDTLADYIARTSGRGQMPSPVELVNLFSSISQAVDYAHQRGMIHRDIKPANILLDSRTTTHNPMGEPLLTDFGVARLIGASSNTLSGAQLGTPLYISPEQASGIPGDERSDIYSLGVILYEMVTGVPPFRGETPHDVMRQHLQTPPMPPVMINPHISPALNQVILRSLAKEPAARYASASELTAALALALQVPVPSNGTQTHDANATQISQFSHSLTGDANATQAAHSLSGDSHATQIVSPTTGSSQPTQRTPLPFTGNPPTPAFTPVTYGTMPTPQTSQSGITAMYPPTAVTPPPIAPTTVAPPTAPPVSPPRAQNTSKRKWPVFLISMILLIVLTGVSAAAYTTYMLWPKTPVATSPIVGRAFFVSSGQIAPQSSQGIADQLQIDLKNVAPPKPGYSYYVWLLSDHRPEPGKDLTGPRPIKPPILVTNQLTINNGNAHFLYPGDDDHSNLLSTTSRLLVTEETANQHPAAPSQDKATWRYYGEIPQAQIPNAAAGFSALVHIRHLFYDETNVEVLGLKGGLDIWLFRNTEKLVEWATSARDDWHQAQTSDTELSLMINQFIRILQYLDGCRHANLDLPDNTSVLVDPYVCRVALLSVDPAQGKTGDDPPGYTTHTALHVKQVSIAPDVSTELRQRTSNILTALTNTETWLRQVRTNASKLVKMNANQLRQPEAGELLDEMVSSALYAYLGKLDPASNQIQPGVLQAHYDIQLLTTIQLSKKLPDSI